MKLPPNAKKVFQGEIFSVHQWEQELYDGSTATFEMLERPGTIQIIATTGNEVYVSHEEQPTKPRAYSLLGGRQEPNEEPLATAKRELLEESGLISDDWELMKEYKGGGKIDWPMSLFIARDCKKVAEPKLDPGEKIDVEKVSFEKFLEIVCAEDFWGAIIANDILRMRLNPEKVAEFKEKLFRVR